MPVIEKIGTDPRCEVHQMVLGTREDKEGWFNVLCPSSLACVDEGIVWASIVSAGSFGAVGGVGSLRKGQGDIVREEKGNWSGKGVYIGRFRAETV